MSDTLRGSLRSLTVWFNAAAAGLLAVLPELLPALADAAPSLQPYLGPDVYRYLMLAIVVGNIVLRVRTSTSLADKAPPKGGA